MHYKLAPFEIQSQKVKDFIENVCSLSDSQIAAPCAIMTGGGALPRLVSNEDDRET